MTKQAVTLEPGDLAPGDRENLLFMGTSVAAGTGQAVVVATAMHTELGRIAGLMNEAGAEEKTPLQQKLVPQRQRNVPVSDGFAQVSGPPEPAPVSVQGSAGISGPTASASGVFSIPIAPDPASSGFDLFHLFSQPCRGTAHR